MSRMVSALFSLTLMAAVVGTVAVGSAQDVSMMWHKEPMITDGHPLYAAKQAAETGVEELAPNDTAAADAKLAHTDRRVSETERLVENDQPQPAAATAGRYTAKIQEVVALGNRTSTLAQRQLINTMIANTISHHQDMLQTILNNAPAAAESAIQDAAGTATWGHETASRNVAAALQLRAQQRIDTGNDHMDAGNYTAAKQAFVEAEAMLQEATQRLDTVEQMDVSSRQAAIADTRAAAADMQAAADAYMDGDDNTAAEYRQRAQGRMP